MRQVMPHRNNIGRRPPSLQGLSLLKVGRRDHFRVVRRLALGRACRIPLQSF